MMYWINVLFLMFFLCFGKSNGIDHDTQSKNGIVAVQDSSAIYQHLSTLLDDYHHAESNDNGDHKHLVNDYHIVYIYSRVQQEQVIVLQSILNGLLQGCIELYQDDMDENSSNIGEKIETETHEQVYFYGIDVQDPKNVLFLKNSGIMQTNTFHIFQYGQLISTFGLDNGMMLDKKQNGKDTKSYFALFLRQLTKLDHKRELISKIHCGKVKKYDNANVFVYNDVSKIGKLNEIMSHSTKPSHHKAILFSNQWIDPRISYMFDLIWYTVFDVVFELIDQSFITNHLRSNKPLDFINLNGNTMDYYYYDLLNEHHIIDFPTILFVFHNDQTGNDTFKLVNFKKIYNKILLQNGVKILSLKPQELHLEFLVRDLKWFFQECVLSWQDDRVVEDIKSLPNRQCSFYFEG